MWPYSNDEQVALIASGEWLEQLPKAIDADVPTSTPANDSGHTDAANDNGEDNRPFDPQTFIGK